MKTGLDDGATESLRLFYALWPDDETRSALQHWQSAIAGRATHVCNLHLTLVFLGQQPSNRVPTLRKIMAQLPATEFVLVLDRIGYFRRKKITWAGASTEPEELFTLQHNLAEALTQHNVQFDNQSPFKPHLTLARDAPAPDEFEFPAIKWRADRIVLVRSVAHPGAVRYNILAGREFGTTR